MSEVLLYRLKMNREAILKDLEPDQVVDYLYQEDVLDGDKYEEVRDKGPRKKQAALLLSYVERQSTAIEKMIKALERSSQRHLAQILQEPLENEVNLSKGISDSFHGNLINDVYPMTHIPCGYAVIINNIEFAESDIKLDRRDGSEVDVERMRALFEYLQFKVDVHQNKGAAEIKSIVRNYTVDVDHKNFDCFVLFLMSHGFPSGIYGSDSKKLQLQSIRKYLRVDKCYSLANKPKLIFVQACRGSSPDQGYVLTDSPNSSGTMPSQELGHSSTHASSNVDTCTFPDTTLPKVDVQYIPQDADIFTAYASSAEHAALRNTSTGGWFVTQLYDVMLRWAKTEDLQTMMTKVTNQVSLQRTRKSTSMQCPQMVGNLRAKVYFKPKDY